MRHHLFLSTHEALTNILKHSGATRVRVAMTCNHGLFEIEISDNGKGINASTIEPDNEGATLSSGDGLNNMRRRLADVGGQCSIESVPGQGTRIRFAFVLNQLTSDLP